ncbi:MAG: polymorphic toxin type 44 domain-containing protein [Zhenhengia sp.]|uniref:polymorphic toxin type 44 domain-containing protein n=1 Tax=Zhenhengia sp. TaxID=2944208 RepID=UPI00399462DA
MGRAVFSPFILKSAAGLAQVLNGDFNMEFIGSYFDDPRDTANIQWGIDYYKLDNN